MRPSRSWSGALVMAAAAADDGATPADYAHHRRRPLAAFIARRAAVLAVSTVTTTAYVLHAHPGTLAALPVRALSRRPERGTEEGVVPCSWRHS